MCVCVCVRYRIAHRWSYRKTKYTVTLRIFSVRFLGKSILWRYFFDIFSKNAFYKIKSRVIHQIKGLFITNFLMIFNLSIFEPISSYWRNTWNPWWMLLSRVLLHERDRERKICTEETLYSLSLTSFADMLSNLNFSHAAIIYPAYRRCFLTTESYLMSMIFPETLCSLIASCSALKWKHIKHHVQWRSYSAEPSSYRIHITLLIFEESDHWLNN